jgi:hypothetical protein
MRTRPFTLIPGASIYHTNWNFVAHDLSLYQCQKLESIITDNYMLSYSYQLSQTCSPFLQGYREPLPNCENGWVFVEFWSQDTAAMQVYIDWINKIMDLNPKIVVIDQIKAGDYAWNPKTGEIKPVIEANAFEVTFSGSNKWESIKNWRPTDYPSRCLTPELVERFNVNGY